MIVLVKFRVLPLTVMHDVMGLSCFLVYLLLPAVWLTRWLVLRFGKEVVDKGLPALATKRRLWPNVLLLLLAAGVVIYAKRELRNDIKVTVPAAIAGYKGEAVPGNVIKLSNEQALIYIKPIAAFYAPEHHPMICWKGSGYQFSQVIEKDHIYQGVLEKASEEPLYTAWWYDDGQLSTNSQLKWRMENMRTGRCFSLVNITAASPEALRQQIHIFRQSRALQGLLPN